MCVVTDTNGGKVCTAEAAALEELSAAFRRLTSSPTTSMTQHVVRQVRRAPSSNGSLAGAPPSPLSPPSRVQRPQWTGGD